LLSSYAFLTERPMIAVVNVDAADAAREPPVRDSRVAETLAVCAQAEAEIAQLEPAEQGPFLEDLGVAEPLASRLMHACRRAAGLIHFLTVTEQETRAWPIRAGSTALEAAGKVHTDMARGFIRAETVAFDDLVAAGDMRAARAAGKVRQEGKNYIVQDGDVIHFKFNV